MSPVQQFLTYARTFEHACETDDWGSVCGFFARDLALTGTGEAEYRGDLIVRLQDRLDSDAARRMQAWMQAHGALLG
jgi:hypothetical protein